MPSPTLVPRIGPARLARAIGREAALVALSLVVGALSFGAMLTFVDEAGATGIRIELLLLLDAAAGLLGIAILPLRRFAPSRSRRCWASSQPCRASGSSPQASHSCRSRSAAG
ncbi:hypothetical protein BC477_00555 [Clavibacter michiganensis subsp. michiganensis]|uniref:Uncharacterized protein n=1 Tax=Clavibacter michiganensis subsp. michiganensis TaxID=33013 RepID=A0A251XFW5_CLAMM|nr:hypothetical protein BC477_00555 [Clavibacter michiganensis subsp. michiganensis]OUE00934.1 hypothetical protein CMMCAS07_15960 [Clavibacter michiganensis subsp. michiganensis]